MSMNYYQILEVHPRASKEVIKAAYKALFKLNANNENVLKKINEAYEVLEDENKRKKYDNQKSIKHGKVIGNYRILEKIADGGFGTTYKAEHIATGELTCIKHASNISVHDEQILLDEARSCWNLRHWGIPAVRDILKMPDDSMALVMSYITGLTLAQVLEKKRYNKGLEPLHVAWITSRALNILKYLHYNGVVHGDIKPQNIIVQEDHQIVLVDYGLAKVKPTRNDKAIGYTPFFAAPELEAGNVPIPESDFYSLGQTMIFALGGDVEYKKIPSTTPAGMCDFIRKLVVLNPLSRPTWKDELDEEFLEVRKKDFGSASSGMLPLDLS